MVSTVPAKKNLFQCKGPPLSVVFIFCFCRRVKAFTSEPFSATCVWKEQKYIWRHQQSSLSKKMGAGRCLVGTWGRWEQERGARGAPWDFVGAVRGLGGVHFIRQLAHLAAWAPWPLSPQRPGCPGCRRQGAGPPQLLAQRVCQAESIKLAVCTVPFRCLVTSTRHPNDSPRGGQAGDALCFSLGQPGHRPYLFPQLVLVDDAFQLLRQLRVLLAELHVPLALLLDLSLDFTQRALEMISYFFPLLLFLPCPLNCFLLLLNGREQCHVRKTHNKRFQKDTVPE